MADLTDEYWADDRAAFEAAMAEGGEDLNCAKCGLVGIEHAYKNDRTRLLYFAWASGREHERAANTKPASEPVQDAASIEGLLELVREVEEGRADMINGLCSPRFYVGKERRDKARSDIRAYAQRLKEGR